MSAQRDRFFIGGEWVAPSSDATIDVIDSTNEEVYYTVAEAAADDMSRAVGAARHAFDEGPWPRLTHAARAECLRALGRAQRLQRHPRRDVAVVSLAPARLADPQLLAFMGRIRIEPDPAYDRGGDATRHQSRMKVTALDGRVFEKDAPHRKGSPDFPMTDGERHGKFRRLAGAALPAAAVERIIREVESLEQAPDVRALVEPMRAAQE